MNSINARIKEIREKLCNNSNEEFANTLGEKPNTTSNWIGDRNLGKQIIDKIINKFPEINPSWLLIGEGEMLKSGEIQEKSNDITKNTSDDELPLIPFEYAAGYGEDNEGIILSECERYKIPEFKNIGAEFLVRVGGSSMYPKYSSGDILACRKINDILFFQWGKIYVIDSSQGQMVKRICRHDNEDLVWLVSDNKDKYEPFIIPKNDIRSLSIVVGVLRLE